MLLANENAIESGGYIIPNSLRFQSASSTSANRTFTTPTNNKIWTWSAWVKRGSNLGSGNQQHLFDSWASASSQTGFIFSATTDTMELYDYTGTYGFQLVTTQVFRDPSAWYHIVIACDTTQATASNRLKLYINGSQVTAFSTATYPSLNYNTLLNAARAHYLGQRGDSSGFFDGYLSEVNFIDGQALTPSSFGETDTTSGQWIAKAYSGSRGTNGFYLPFSNGTSTTTLGADSSGNSNNWTLTNFTRSAGVDDCWMKDVPSGNGSSGTQPNSNYAILNPINKGANATISKANSLWSAAIMIGGNHSVVSSIATPTTGKWYAEVTPTGAEGAGVICGIIANTNNLSTLAYAGSTSTSYGYAGFSGNKYNSSSATAYGATFTSNDVIGIAYDADAATLTFYKNGTSQGVAYSSIPSANYYFGAGNNSASNSVQAYFNFGQRSFAYTPPSGFKALCTANLPVATIKQGNLYMDASLWTGNGASNRTITNTAGFKPDLVWVKGRSSASWNHFLNDSVRGFPNYLISSSTGAEGTTSPAIVSSAASNGFVIQANGNSNNTGDTYVGWQWQAGQGSTSSNTNGSITSTVSVNATAGFSIVTYTGTGGGTVGHGLGVAPKMIIVKRRNAVSDWAVLAQAANGGAGQNGYLLLDTTGAFVSSASEWSSTAPTSSVFTVGASSITGQTGGTYVAYCFAEIAGFSKFGSYTGNGSADGPFVYTGFRPKYVLIKCSSTAGTGWVAFDTSRNPYNIENAVLYPNLSNAEVAFSSLDGVSNGFKIRNTDGSMNTNAATYIYMAFAENPFAQANAR